MPSPSPERTTPNEHHNVVIVGGGQSGLSLSYYLQQRSIEHIVLEKNHAMHTWQTSRWDSFSLVTPNWQCKLPGYDYAGNDPHGFMKKDEINAYLAGFRQHVNAPLREGVAVRRVLPHATHGYTVQTSKGDVTAAQVVVASGGYDLPVTPPMAKRIPASVTQIHSEQYRSAAVLPEGTVLVVGSGQSGSQIAEDLHLAGRKVFLAVGNAPRCARFYRGKDVVDWLSEMNYYDIPVHEHPLREGVRDNTNHYVTGRDGGRDIDLRKFALEGMTLLGQLDDLTGDTLQFAPDLTEKLDAADAVYNRINASIDKYIDKKGLHTTEPPSVYQPVWTPAHERTAVNFAEEGITCIVWCIGFQIDFSWVEAPVFDERGQPRHERGVTNQLGLYFLGLPWLYTWGSGRFSGVARDALYLAEQIDARQTPPTQLNARAVTLDTPETTYALSQ